MKKYIDILDAIKEILDDRENELIQTGDTAAEVNEKLSEIEND